MFFSKPGKPDPLKKTIYLLAAIILGLLLSFIAHALIEVNYLRSALDQGQAVYFYGNCTLPPELQIILFILGAVGGFFFGRFCWHKVYVERAWEKKNLSHK